MSEVEAIVNGKSDKAIPVEKMVRPDPEGDLLVQRHDAALFKRKGNKWKWQEGGTLQRYPRIGEMLIVAYSKKQFSHTQPILEIISVDKKEPNAVEIVLRDCESSWLLILPSHSNNIKEILKEIK